MNKGFTKSKKYTGPKVGKNAITMLAGFRTKRSEGFMKANNETTEVIVITTQDGNRHHVDDAELAIQAMRRLAQPCLIETKSMSIKEYQKLPATIESHRFFNAV